MPKWYDLKPIEVQEAVGLSDEALPWLCRGESVVGDTALSLPGAAHSEELLERLGVTEKDRSEILDSRPDPDEDPAVWWVLERAYRELADSVGRIWQELPFPVLPENLGPIARNLYVWAFLSVVPIVRNYHKERGIPDRISWESLQDIGQKISTHRQIYGTSGTHVPGWSTLVFSGAVYQLGRLQFNRYHMPIDMPSSPNFPDVPQRGDNILIPHIAEGGKMTSEECMDSFMRAREFFREFFPGCPIRYAAGFGSWLLDEQLKYYLHRTSNVLFFQSLFNIAPRYVMPDPVCEWTQRDSAILEYVFHRLYKGDKRPDDIISELPQDTTLKRSYVKHLESGGHWFARCGWFDLDTATFD